MPLSVEDVRDFLTRHPMQVGMELSSLASKTLGRDLDSGRPPIADVSIDYRRLDVAMARQFPNRSDVETAVKQVSSKNGSTSGK